MYTIDINEQHVGQMDSLHHIYILHEPSTCLRVREERLKLLHCYAICSEEHCLHAMFLSHSLLALSPADVLPAVYLCTNKIAADHENKELNIGGSLVTAALEEACGTNRLKIREMYNKFGDLGWMIVS
ncbi:hypothetical protein ACSQ67_023388 [Phaseolus vulgaris]